MSDQQQFFKNFSSIERGSRYVTGIGHKKLPVLGKGDIEVETTVRGAKQSSTLKDVLYIPDIGTNLFSIVSATHDGAEVKFINNEVIIVRNDHIEITGQRIGKSLYSLNIEAKEKREVDTGLQVSLDIWHRRLGHINYTTLKKMLSENHVNGLSFPEHSNQESVCEGCLFGKMPRLKFKTGRDRATEIGELIHSDVMLSLIHI